MDAETRAPQAHGQPLRAVLFDLDGTLYHQPPVRRGMALALGAHLLRSPRRGLATVRAIRTFRTLREDLRELGRPGESLEERQYVEPAARAGVSPEALRALVHEWMIERPLALVAGAAREDLLETLDRLAGRGLRLGVYSDFPVEEKLAALGCLGRFDPRLASTDPEINAFKPHPRGFLVACERWCLAPAEVLFVGDRADVDAGGARAAGMPCALVGSARADDGDVPRFPTLGALCEAFSGRFAAP